MEFVRTSLLTGFSTGTRLAAAFAANKVIALVAGPSGMALVGHLQNLASILQGSVSGIFSGATVNSVAELKAEPEALNRFLSLCCTCIFFLSVAVGGTTAGLSWWLSSWILGAGKYWWVFVLLGCSVPLYCANNLMLSVVNGRGDVSRLTRINVTQSVLVLIISVALPLLFGVAGAYAVVVFAPAAVVAAIVPELRSQGWLRLRRINLGSDADGLRRLGSFALMAVTTAVCAPLAQLLVRRWLIERCSIAEAGYWQALLRLSGAYMAFFTATLAVYFLPKFSAQTVADAKAELRRALGLMLPVLLAVLVSLWFLRQWLVVTLLSDAFAPIAELLSWQFAGDFLKIISWSTGSLLLAKRATWWVVGGELGVNSLFVVSALLLIGDSGHGGALGATQAYCLMYAAHAVLMIVAVATLEAGKG